MSEKLVAKFECRACPYPCYAEAELMRDEGNLIPTKCLFDGYEEEGVCNWKRVEQSTEGDSTSHVPVIHEKSEVAEKKWEYDMVVEEGCLKVVAVDSETEKIEAYLFFVNKLGVLQSIGNVKSSLEMSGYLSQGLRFDDRGAIRVEQ